MKKLKKREKNQREKVIKSGMTNIPFEHALVVESH